MAQKKGRRTEAQRTAEIEAALPEGIRIGRWGDKRRKRFYVRYGADRRVESFESEQERNDRTDELIEARTTGGAVALDINMAEWRRYQDFRQRCPASLHELEALWAKYGRREALPTITAAARYTALRLREMGSGGADAHRHMKLHLKRLTDIHGSRDIREITAELLRDTLDGLINPRDGKPMALVTKHDHLKNWNTFFERCVLEEWLDKNPCARVILPTADTVDKVSLKPREVFDLLRANRNQPVIGRIAFELFGGLRASSAARLRPDDVKRASKGIRLPGSVVVDEETQATKLNHKGHKTVFRQGHPEVLWAWFDHAEGMMWEDVTKGNYDEKKREAFIRAGVTNPGNILRDTFASYLFAQTNNLPLVSSLMQHTSTKTTLIYVGMAEKADADLVMAMMPSAVLLPWETFLRKHNPNKK